MSIFLRPVPVNAGGVVATATAPLAHRCPFVDEADQGTITAVWRIDTHTLELHALHEYLRSFASVETSHETLTLQIAADLAAVEGLDLLRVATRWQTAGIQVTCEVSGDALFRHPVDAEGA